MNFVSMSWNDVLQFACRGIPYPNRTVVTSRAKPATVRAEYDTFSGILMTLQ
jgi:hypothetical protein